MHGELVAGGDELMAQGTIFRELTAEQEERRMDMVLGEEVEHQGGGTTARTVIKGQCHVVGVADARQCG